MDIDPLPEVPGGLSVVLADPPWLFGEAGASILQLAVAHDCPAKRTRDFPSQADAVFGATGAKDVQDARQG